MPIRSMTRKVNSRVASIWAMASSGSDTGNLRTCCVLRVACCAAKSSPAFESFRLGPPRAHTTGAQHATRNTQHESFPPQVGGRVGEGEENAEERAEKGADHGERGDQEPE